MQIPFRLFVQEHPDGSITARALTDHGFVYRALTREGAINGVRRELEAALNDWGGNRGLPPYAVLELHDTELRRVLVDLTPDPNPTVNSIPITVSLLVTVTTMSRGRRWIVTAPRIPDFSLILDGDDELEERATATLVQWTQGWSAQRILAVDQMGHESIEIVTVPMDDLEDDGEDDKASSDSDDPLDHFIRPRSRKRPRVPDWLRPAGSQPTKQETTEAESTEEDSAEEATEDDEMPAWLKRRRAERAAQADEGAESVLGACGINLTEQALSGQLGRADRREALIERVLGVLAGTGANSVVLVGEPGVGKTALVHEVIARILQGNVPVTLQERLVWFVTPNNLVAGMTYIGDWQDRITKLVREVRNGRQIVYMGEPVELIEVGRTKGSDNNMARFLRPYLASGDLTVIFECSPGGYAAALAEDASFVHTLHRIDVPAANDEDTRVILQTTAQRLETSGNVRFAPEGLVVAQELARRFMPYRAFPGKGVSVMQDTVRAALGSSQRSSQLLTLTREQVVKSFTEATGLPEVLLSDTAALNPAEVRTFFEERLVGQPEVVTLLCELIAVIKAGLHDPDRPLASYFFVGPTGVGKTEAAKVLAEWLFSSRDRMVRFDMSEYAGEDALVRLVGAAWREDGAGELTRRVREQPFCVVLLDELEKAHPKVFDALLGVLGEGRLSDARGNTVDFRNTVIIMTSNLGANRKEREKTGFATSFSRDAQSDDRMLAHFIREAEDFFRPEFYNRISRVVAFRPLTVDGIRKLALRELGKLLMREGVTRRNLLVEIDDAVVETLVTQGFHPLYGARPLQRAIERLLIVPLAQAVVNHEANLGNLLRFCLREGQIKLDFVPVDTPTPSSEDTSPPQTPAQRRLETDLAAILALLRTLREQCAAMESSATVQGLRAELSALLRRTHAPNFWDDPNAARTVLARVYDFDGVLKRLQGVWERVDALSERGRQMRLHRDRRGIPELAQAVDRLHTDLDYLELELAGAHAAERPPRVLLRVQPIGRGGEDWAMRLLQMYQAWATRKGYDWTLISPAPADSDASDGVHLPSATLTALYLQGANVATFLHGESGIHRLDSGGGDERVRHLARVSVLPVIELPEEPDQLQAALERLALRGTDGNTEAGVVRAYSQGRQHFVKDTRTNTRVGDVVAVLQHGQIDAFLLAYLRREGEQEREGSAT